MPDDEDSEGWAQFLEACSSDDINDPDNLKDRVLEAESEVEVVTQKADRMQTQSEKPPRRLRSSTRQREDEGPSSSFAFGTRLLEDEPRAPRSPEDIEMAEAVSAGVNVMPPRGSTEAQREEEMQHTPPIVTPTTQAVAVVGPPRSAPATMEAIWNSSTAGAENMARRTEIVVSPAVGQYTTSQTPTAEREANWKARGLAPMEFTEAQLADMRALRECFIEFSAYSKNSRYIPLGYDIEDLLRLYVAREPPILRGNNLHLKMTAGQIIQIRDSLRLHAEALSKQGEALSKHARRVQDVEHRLWNHQARIDAWSEETSYDTDGPDQFTADLDLPAAEAMQEQPSVDGTPVVSAPAVPAEQPAAVQPVVTVNWMG